MLPCLLRTIFPYSAESLGIAFGAGVPTSQVWPTANDAILVPFRISEPFHMENMFVFNGAVVNGNFDIGVYDESGYMLISSGSTAQAGINSPQLVPLVLTLGPGIFYMALAFDNVVAQVYLLTITYKYCRAVGMSRNAASFPLPANIAFASVLNGFIPMFGMMSEGV